MVGLLTRPLTAHCMHAIDSTLHAHQMQAYMLHANQHLQMCPC